jgi:flagellar basal-body rod protein FlgG
VEASFSVSSRWSDFTNDQGAGGDRANLFWKPRPPAPTDRRTARADGLGTLRQGYLEDSSVDAVREITELIEAQRGYELNAKVITAADQMLGATTQVR